MKYDKKTRNIFIQPADKVAPFLLGKLICRRLQNGGIHKFRICEVEAYNGNDTANYGYQYIGKKPSKATIPLFKEGGISCLYAGMFLIVCGDVSEPDNVLIRACAEKEQICSGPLKVADALKVKEIDWEQGVDLLNSDIVWLESDEGIIGTTCKTQRIGLGKNVSEEDRKKACRFIMI